MAKRLATIVVALAQSIETKAPERPSIQAKVDQFKFTSRIDFNNPLLMLDVRAGILSGAGEKLTRRSSAAASSRS